MSVDREHQPADEISGGSTGRVEDTGLFAPVRRDEEELWLDRFARYLGFGIVTDRFAPDVPPSFVYAVFTVVGWTGLSTVADLFVFGNTPIYVSNPYFLLQPAILLVAVYGAHSLTRSYREAVDEMRLSERADDPDRFLDVTPAWLPWVLFGTAAGLQLIRTGADFATFSTTGIVANGLVYPFVYAPIIVQFLVVYVAIEFVVPWRLYTSNVGIYFLDPHGVGGLRPIGELVKKAYYYVFLGLLVYALITYAPGVDSWAVSAAAGTIFTGVWIATIATVAFAVLVLHRFLHREKRQELQRLEAALHDLIERPWDVREYSIPEDAREDVEDLRERIRRVSETREYPATFSIWTQLLLGVVVPKAVQLFLETT